MNICFVCYGNSCRSPMAEYIFKKMLSDAKIEDINITSAGTNVYQSYPMSAKAQEQLILNNIPVSEHKTTTFTEQMYINNDFIIALDSYVLDIIKYKCDLQKGTFNQKLRLLREFDDKARGRDVFDPYGTDRYDIAFTQIYKACEGLLAFIKKITGYVEEKKRIKKAAKNKIATE